MAPLAKKASELVEMLDLKIHPEGGFYTETFRDFSVTLSKSQLPPQCAHSIGFCHCVFFIDRLYNFKNTGFAVPRIDPTKLEFLQQKCPPQVITFDLKLFMNPKSKSSSSFGNSFYCSVLEQKVLLGLEMIDSADKVDRPVSTSIYFLLPAGSVSHLHRIPCAETWHFYSGEPLTVFELHDDGRIELTVLGSDLDAGHRPQYTVPPNVWFGSFPTLDVSSFATDGSHLVGDSTRDPELHYSLVGCTCAPAFQFDDFELAKLSDVEALAPQAQPFFDYLVIPDKEA